MTFKTINKVCKMDGVRKDEIAKAKKGKSISVTGRGGP
jgi:hypothetical protein